MNIVIALATEMPARRDFDVFVPTARGTLVPAEKCVFNNMEWLPQEEQELTRGEFDLVHPKLSQAVSHACGCLGLSFLATSSAAEQDRWYEAAGQSEPLTVRLKNLLKDYPADATVFKELVQNADDAGAHTVHFVWDWRRASAQPSLMTPEMGRWQGPALWVYNSSQFARSKFLVEQLESL